MVSVERSNRVDPDQEQREKLFRLIIAVAVGALIATLVAVVWLVQGKNSAQDDLEQAPVAAVAGRVAIGCGHRAHG